MSVFEVVFNLVGLVLGLALVEVLSGLARLMKSREHLNIGWLVPLVGVWMLGDVASFWGQAYELRELMPSVWPSLGVSLVITSAYYLAASLVIPAVLDSQSGYDEAYWKNKRLLFGIVLLCNGATWGIGLALGRVWSSTVWAINITYAVSIILIMFVPNRRLNIALLLAMVANLTWGFATP